MRATALALVIVAMPSAAAQFDLGPAQSVLRFTLPATLHIVRGELRFLRGTLAIDASGGTNGLFVVEATSANTGNS